MRRLVGSDSIACGRGRQISSSRGPKRFGEEEEMENQMSWGLGRVAREPSCHKAPVGRLRDEICSLLCDKRLFLD